MKSKENGEKAIYQKSEMSWSREDWFKWRLALRIGSHSMWDILNFYANSNLKSNKDWLGSSHDKIYTLINLLWLHLAEWIRKKENMQSNNFNECIEPQMEALSKVVTGKMESMNIYKNVRDEITTLVLRHSVLSSFSWVWYKSGLRHETIVSLEGNSGLQSKL